MVFLVFFRFFWGEFPVKAMKSHEKLVFLEAFFGDGLLDFVPNPNSWKFFSGKFLRTIFAVGYIHWAFLKEDVV